MEGGADPSEGHNEPPGQPGLLPALPLWDAVGRSGVLCVPPPHTRLCCGGSLLPGSEAPDPKPPGQTKAEEPREQPELQARFCAGRGIWEPVQCRRDR